MDSQTRSVSTPSRVLAARDTNWMDAASWIPAYEKFEHRRAKFRCASQLCQSAADRVSFAEQLRRFFRGLVHGTLDQCRCSRGSQADQAMQAIKASVAECFVASLRLDAVTMKLEHDDSLFSE